MCWTVLWGRVIGRPAFFVLCETLSPSPCWLRRAVSVIGALVVLLCWGGGVAHAAPTASDDTINVARNGTYTFTESTFNSADADNDPLAIVKITSLPASGKGTLEVNGTAIASGDLPKTVTKADLDVGYMSVADE